ncbi:MAG: DUF1592 domain-containing protein [Acidobacteria bacterium]|nr:DUF1592 domain-containing protein [Acidobacteriota bacterium]
MIAGSLPQAFRPVLDRYCVTCHNERLKTAGLTLDTLDLTSVARDSGTWEKVIRKLNTGMMPPAGMPRPDDATARSFVASLAGELDRAAAASPNPGPSTIHRLNRAEYANAIRDLLALDVDVAALLPPDDSISGFDNIADALGVSPVLLERHLSAAMRIAPFAVGTYRDGPVESIYRAPGDLNQTLHVEGLPFGTRGGLLIPHTFPADGEYVIKATLWRNNAGRIRGLEAPHQLEFLVDGDRVHEVTVGTPEQFAISFDDRLNTKTTAEFDATLLVRVPVKAGPRNIGVTFAAKTAAQDPQKLRPLLSPFDAVDTHGVPRVDAVSIIGPYNPAGPGETPSRARIFSCRPATPADEAPCARKIVSALAQRAYRRPVNDADLGVLLSFYEAGRRAADFDTGIERAVVRILTSPEFIFRVEKGAPNARPGTVTRVSDLELASRLSFFLWSSLPDEELLQTASRGGLRTAGALDRQVRRMLVDPRADALVANFAGQWLYLRNLRTVAPIADEFPDFDDDLRQAFKRETELLFDSIIREDRSVIDLMTADYTFVNERLARHYGIPRVYGSHFRRVPVRDEARRGLLGHGSILSVTSNANRTSPVRRGKWILENLIGSPPPPPPPNVPPLTENKDRPKPLSMREQMEQHRANPACASCHRLMDPLGLALENFDAVGAWRVKDANADVDAKVQLADGTNVDGAVGLRQALLRRPDIFVGTFTEKLLTYALGRSLEHYDMPTVRGIVRDASPGDFRFSSLVVGIVKSTPFTMRVTGAGESNP